MSALGVEVILKFTRLQATAVELGLTIRVDDRDGFILQHEGGIGLVAPTLGEVDGILSGYKLCQDVNRLVNK